MGFSDTTPTLPGVTEFWTWWDEVRPRIETALGDGTFVSTLADALTAAVQSIDPGLQWEIGPDDDAVHALSISGAGDHALRALAERVVAAGPENDPSWTFHPVRLPKPGSVDSELAYAGEDMTLATMQFSILIDEERQVLDLVVHHPAFVRLEERQQLTVAFLVIDGILGEDGVERWVGSVEVSSQGLADGLPAQALAEAADGLADRHTEPSWCLMSGSDGDGRSLFVMARRPLKRVEAPTFDLHAAVMLIGFDSNTDGLPTSEALQALTALEDGLTAALGDDALVAAHVTVSGRRTTHLYCDQFGPAPGLISTWTSTLDSGPVDAVVSFELDPSWEAVKPFR